MASLDIKPVGYYDDEIEESMKLESEYLDGQDTMKLERCISFHHTENEWFLRNPKDWNSGAASDVADRHWLTQEQFDRIAAVSLSDSDLKDWYGNC